MNLRKQLGLLALAGLALAGTTALAQVTPLAYTDGDLFLGFRVTSGADNTGLTSDYLVNIGQPSAYETPGSAFTVTGLGSMVTDLDATFGSNWSTRPNVHWSVSGKSGSSTLYATKAQAVVGTLNTTGWLRSTATAQSQAVNKIASMATTYVGATNNSTANNPKGIVQSTSTNNAYARFQPNGIGTGNPNASYDFFSPTIEGNFGAGTAGTVLEFYKLTPGVINQTAGTPGQLLGYFTIDNSAVVTFTPASNVTQSVMHLSQSSYSVVENAGSITVNVIRGGGTGAAADVVVNTSNNTAIAGTDYTAVSSFPVHFNAGETSQPVVIPITNRTGFQGNRGFRVSLSGASGGTLTAPSNIVPVTITDVAGDANPGVIEFSAATYSFNRTAATGSANVTLTRSNAGPAVAVTVDKVIGANTTITVPELSTTVLPSVVNFANAETSKQFTISYNIATGTLRLLELALSGPTNGATLGANTNTVATIKKADTVKPTVAITSPTGTSVPNPGTFSIAGTVKENDEAVTVTCTLNGVNQPVTVGPFVANANIAWNVTANPVQAENGVNTIVVTAVDAVGNTTIVTKNVTYANTATFTTLAGTYNGALLPVAGSEDHDTAGFLAVTVTASGAISGKLTISGITKAFSGILRSSGAARFKNPAVLADHLDVIDATEYESFLGALAFSQNTSTGEITGTLSEEFGGALLSNVTAQLVPFKSTNLLTGPLLNAGTKGSYTVAVLSKAQTPSLAANLYPQGDGAASLTLLNTGKATLKGFLADGTAFTAAGAITSTGSVALHTPLYRKSGSITGVVQFNLADIDTDLEGTDFLWVRPAKPRARYYPGGWTTGIRTDVIGTAYNSPADLDFGQGANALPAGNATLEFSLPGVITTVTRTINVDPATGKVTHNPAVGADHKLTLTTGTGLSYGTFTYGGSTVAGFKGALLNKAGGGINRGYGYFLTVPTLTYGAAGESGQVQLQP